MDFKFDLQRFAASVTAPVVYDETAQPPVTTQYQLKWGEDTQGLFAVNVTPVYENNAIVSYKIAGTTIAEQTTATKLTKPDSGMKYYLAVANDFTAADTQNGTPAKNEVAMKLYAVDAAGTVTEIDNSTTPIVSTSVFNFTAPAKQALVLDVSTPAKVKFNLTKVAADSVLTLKEGDKAATGTLVKGESITAGGIKYVSNGGALSFVGVNDNIHTNTKLQTGTIKLNSTDGNLVTVYGASGTGLDSVIATDDLDGVVVKVANGKVTSITGLDAKVNNQNAAPATVTVTEVTSTKTTTTTVAALDTTGTMFEKTVVTTTSQGMTTDTTYLDLSKSGGEVFSASYKKPVYTAVGNVGATTGSGKVAYMAFATANDPTSNAAALTVDNTQPSTTATRGEVGSDGKFHAAAGGYYLKITSSTTAATTTAPATTTITNLEVVKSNAAGTLTKVAANDPKASFAGKYTLAINNNGANGQIVKFTKPATAKYTVDIRDADIRSKFTGLNLANDVVTTAAAEYTNLPNGTYTIYKAGNTGTAVDSTVTVSGKFTVNVGNGGTFTNAYGLNSGETFTLVKDGAITVFKGTGVKTIDGTKYDTLTIETTAADGTYNKYEGVRIAAGELEGTLLDAGNFDTTAEYVKNTNSLVTDFDWTLNKSHVGYFAANGSAVTVKAQKTSITSANPANYIKAELTDNNGVVEVALKAVTATKDDDTPATTDYKGTITINAPAAAVAFTARDTSIDDDTVIKYTNVAAGSTVAALGKKDTVTTAALAEGASVVVGANNTNYIAAANNTKLTINMVQVDENTLADGLYSGTAKITQTTGDIRVGSYVIANASDAPVTVTANAGKTFSVGALDDGDSFTVTKDGENAVTFVKFGSYIYDTTDGKMYSIGKNTSISSANLDITKWKDAIDLTGNVEHKGTSVINLADADKAYASTDYTNAQMPLHFVRDKFVTAVPTATATVTTKVVNAVEQTAAAAYTLDAGSATKDKVYTGVDTTAPQTISVTNGWTVNAGAVATTFKGAASGTDKLVGNTADDTFMLSGADDIVDVMNAGGKDTISNYNSGKDKIIADISTYTLSTTTANEVYLSYTNTDNYVLLKNTGGKAVTIGADDGNGGIAYTDHFFGNGKVDAQNKTKADTFNFVDGAYYHGNNSGNNTLKIGTLSNYKGKTTSGITLDINLGTQTAQYQSINNLDATSSANEVKLTAGGTQATDKFTLKGGSYKSTLVAGAGSDTLVGGTGEDTFDISTIAGEDKIQNLDANNDVIAWGQTLDLDTVAVDGNNVVFGWEDVDGDDADDDTAYAVVENAAMKGITLKYTDADPAQNKTWKLYAGKAKTNNQFTYEQKDGVQNVYVGYQNQGTESYKDTLKVTTSVSELKVTSTPGNDTNGNPIISHVMPLYQGGKINLNDATSFKEIEEVDASSVKATSAALSEYGSKFIKAHAGVDVTAVASTAGEAGTTFTGSAFNDKFTCGDGNDYITYGANQGSDIIVGFGVGDVIKLNGLSSAEIDELSTANSAGIANILQNGLNNKGLSAGGSLTVNVANGETLKFNKNNNTVTAVQ